MLKIILATVSLFLLFSCSGIDMAGMQQQYKEATCNREKGYEHGNNDAQEGKPMDSSFAGMCDFQDRKEVMAGYREGYEAVSKAEDANGDGVIVKAPGIDIRVGNGQREKAWVCEISVFGDTFSGFGPTRGRAADEARTKCTAKNNAVHCTPTCRIDR
ncbi:MAG: hypothetical protein ACXWQO_17045 [Bdellovibrionota bacterium]